MNLLSFKVGYLVRDPDSLSYQKTASLVDSLKPGVNSVDEAIDETADKAKDATDRATEVLENAKRAFSKAKEELPESPDTAGSDVGSTMLGSTVGGAVVGGLIANKKPGTLVSGRGALWGGLGGFATGGALSAYKNREQIKEILRNIFT